MVLVLNNTTSLHKMVSVVIITVDSVDFAQKMVLVGLTTHRVCTKWFRPSKLRPVCAQWFWSLTLRRVKAQQVVQVVNNTPIRHKMVLVIHNTLSLHKNGFGPPRNKSILLTKWFQYSTKCWVRTKWFCSSTTIRRICVRNDVGCRVCTKWGWSIWYCVTCVEKMAQWISKNLTNYANKNP